ncbi:PqqD family peptide modification chaperone [Halomonas alimentaria]|uniref:PqqD family peptide modification chaperone n=1 Tax=Halomonas alimentaria TaxID=147248 RepID=UPI0024907BBD|nr:PqqD family peptide modification chaperone [Halomonas alimentaria]
MSIDLDSRVCRNPDILTAVIDEEIVMMSAKQGQYFGLSGIGTYIWSLAEDPVQVKELVEMICQSYDIDAETCRADTLPFLNNMISAGLMNLTD